MTISFHSLWHPYSTILQSCDGVSNHQPCDCLLNRLLRGRWKTTSKLRVTGLCPGNSPVAGEFPAQRVSNAENVSIRWRHHDVNSITIVNWYATERNCAKCETTVTTSTQHTAQLIFFEVIFISYWVCAHHSDISLMAVSLALKQLCQRVKFIGCRWENKTLNVRGPNKFGLTE